MHITCPDCSARYNTDPESFPEAGRSVRCARCRNVWHAMPSGGEVLLPDRDAGADTLPAEIIHREPSGQALMVDDSDAAETPGGQVVDIEAEAEARARMAARVASARTGVPMRGGGAARRLQAFAMGAILALLLAGLNYRADVVHHAPSSAGLFAAVGLPVNLRGLDFDNVAQRRIFEDGLPVLIVEGEIVNLEDVTKQVPALRFALRGTRGQEIYAWTVEPRQSALEAGERMSFRTRLSAPPEAAEEVQVRFTGRTRQTAGLGR